MAAVLAIWACGACTPGAPSSPEDTTGSILIEVSSGGVEVPDSYLVAVDDDRSANVGSNGSVIFQGISPGTHVVALTGIPSNCVVAGANPRETVVSEAGTSEVRFQVSCEAMPRGHLAVTTTTSGADLDPDGYEVAIDGGTGTPIGLDDTLTFPDLSVGDHEVELTGVAFNCVVQGTNPRDVPVAEGQTTPTTFAVVCQITTGSIRVSVFTSGTFQDQNGYTVDLDGGMVERVEPNGSVTFDLVAAGDHTLTLGDIRSTCRVEGDNPASVIVTAGTTADVEFQVACSLF